MKLRPAEVSRLGHWLVQNELAECVQGELMSKETAAAAKQQSNAHVWHEPLNQMSQLGKWNPLFLKISLPNPAPVLERVGPWLGWLFSKPFRGRVGHALRCRLLQCVGGVGEIHVFAGRRPGHRELAVLVARLDGAQGAA